MGVSPRKDGREWGTSVTNGAESEVAQFSGGNKLLGGFVAFDFAWRCSGADRGGEYVNGFGAAMMGAIDRTRQCAV